MSVFRQGVLASVPRQNPLRLSLYVPPPPSSTLPNVGSGVLVPQVPEMGPTGTYNGEFTSMYNPADTAHGGLDLNTFQPWMYGPGQQQNAGTTFELLDSVGAPLTIIQSDGLHLGLDNSNSTAGAVVTALGATQAPGTTAYHGYNMSVPSGSNALFLEFLCKFYGNGSTQTYDWQTAWAAGDPTQSGFVGWPGCGEWDVVETGIHGDAPAWTVISGRFTTGPFAGGINNGPGGTNPGYSSPEIGFCTYGILWTTSSVTTYYNGAQVGTQLIVNPGYNNWGVSGYTLSKMFPVAFPSIPSQGGTASPGRRNDMILKYIRTWYGPLVAHP